MMNKETIVTFLRIFLDFISVNKFVGRGKLDEESFSLFLWIFAEPTVPAQTHHSEHSFAKDAAVHF